MKYSLHCAVAFWQLYVVNVPGFPNAQDYVKTKTLVAFKNRFYEQQTSQKQFEEVVL